ncbi:MAG: hypothetical protein HYZ28_19175 [Myxococcales bacterium]|nr:hypothetical protein [Myxococcales bacterium]
MSNQRIFAAIAAALLASQAAAQSEVPSPPPPEPSVYLDRSGLGEWIISDAAFGMQVGLYTTSAIFASSTGPETAPRILAGALLGTGAGVALPLVLTLGKPVPSGHMVFANFAGRWGLATGSSLAMLYASAAGPSSSATATQVTFGILAASGLAGVVGGWVLAPTLNLTPGQASALGSGHQWGFILSSMFLASIQSLQPSLTVTALVTFLAANAGLAATAYFLPQLDVDRSRVIWIDVGGYLGTLVGLGFGLLIAPLNATVTWGAALLGAGGGLATAYLISSGIDEYKNRAPLGTSVATVDRRGVRWAVPVPAVVPEPPSARAPAGGLSAHLGLINAQL